MSGPRLPRSRGALLCGDHETRVGQCSFGAIVETGFSSAMLEPNVNTATMNRFLGVLSSEVDPKDVVVLIMDQAGWHKSKALRVPDSIYILYLPACSPELNPAENLWQYMRSHFLANRAFDDYDHLVDAGTQVYRALTPDVIRSVCRYDYVERAL